MGRMIIHRAWLLRTIALRNKSATMIQRKYKAWRFITLIPRAWRKHKNQCVLRVQRHVRGYLAHSKVWDELRETRLKRNFKFFLD